MTDKEHSIPPICTGLRAEPLGSFISHLFSDGWPIISIALPPCQRNIFADTRYRSLPGPTNTILLYFYWCRRTKNRLLEICLILYKITWNILWLHEKRFYIYLRHEKLSAKFYATTAHYLVLITYSMIIQRIKQHICTKIFSQLLNSIFKDRVGS